MSFNSNSMFRTLHRMAMPLLNTYLNSWWLPASLFGSIYLFWILTIPGWHVRPGILFYFPLLALPLSLAGIACSAIMNCVRDLRFPCLVNTMMCAVCFVAWNAAHFLFFMVSLSRTEFVPDEFAKNLTIPEGIEIAIPYANVEFYRGPAEDRPPQSPPPDGITRGEPRFDLTNVSQPGNYRASIWINPGESGTIYLKAYEITKESPLSPSSIKERSTCRIDGSKEEDELFFTISRFTIYEGNWGEYYAARVEIWFKPDGLWTKERKLMEKVFRVEGWQQ
jgi:hypothetical protein